MLTINTTQHNQGKYQFGSLKPECENCTYTFHDNIYKNFSGWTDYKTGIVFYD